MSTLCWLAAQARVNDENDGGPLALFGDREFGIKLRLDLKSHGEEHKNNKKKVSDPQRLEKESSPE